MDEHVEYRVRPGLEKLVRRFVGYRSENLEPGVHLGLPSTTLTLVLPLDDKLDVSLGNHRGRYAAIASGLHTSAASIHYDTAQIGVHLAIEPLACRELLGVPAAELAGAVIDLDAIWGPLAERLLDAAHSAGSMRDRCAMVERLLRTSEAIGVRREVTNAWRLIMRSHGQITVGAIADAVGWSRRHLEQEFLRELGVSPKQACRLRRFERAVDLVRDQHELAEAAALAGFSDQPHLTRDWRELTGTTPRRWLREEKLAFLQDTARALIDSGSHD